jgi:hypothetical protein
MASGTSSRTAVRASCSTSLGARGLDRCHLLVDDPAGLLEFGSVAHDIDQGRAQVVADDIGEALDFLVGPGEFEGADADLVFQTRVETVEGVPRAWISRT